MRWLPVWLRLARWCTCWAAKPTAEKSTTCAMSCARPHKTSQDQVKSNRHTFHLPAQFINRAFIHARRKWIFRLIFAFIAAKLFTRHCRSMYSTWTTPVRFDSDGFVLCRMCTRLRLDTVQWKTDIRFLWSAEWMKAASRPMYVKVEIFKKWSMFSNCRKFSISIWTITKWSRLSWNPVVYQQLRFIQQI